MKQRYTLFLLILVGLSFIFGWVGCRPSISAYRPSLGKVDVGNFQAFGDGYSAGFANTDTESPQSLLGLYADAQSFAFPALMATQFNLIRNVSFNQHLATDAGSGYYYLTEATQSNCPDRLIQSQIERADALPEWQVGPDASLYATIDNWALPHVKIADITQNDLTTTEKIFMGRLSPTGSVNMTYLDHVQQAEPSFFTLWMGTRDILEYAISGGANPAYPLTPPAEFAKNFARLLDSLHSPGQSGPLGIIGNIPDVTVFPFFHHISHTFSNSEFCDDDPLPLYIRRSSNSGESVEAIQSDYILLRAKDRIGEIDPAPGNPLPKGLDPENPLPESWVLDFEEAYQLRLHVEAYNDIIDSLIQSHNASLSTPAFVKVDLYNLFQNLNASGITLNGLEITNEYLLGGIFSLDGLYLTPRGQALIANEFINAINQAPQWSATVPFLNITDYQGVVFP
ncbi:MAG: SGNH/GDSL hydrolase family protein [Bacteroidota bacterium]